MLLVVIPKNNSLTDSTIRRLFVEENVNGVMIEISLVPVIIHLENQRHIGHSLLNTDYVFSKDKQRLIIRIHGLVNKARPKIVSLLETH